MQYTGVFTVCHLDIFAGEVTGGDPDKLRPLSPAVVRRNKVRLRIIQEPPAESHQIRVHLIEQRDGIARFCRLGTPVIIVSPCVCSLLFWFRLAI